MTAYELGNHICKTETLISGDGLTWMSFRIASKSGRPLVSSTLDCITGSGFQIADDLTSCSATTGFSALVKDHKHLAGAVSGITGLGLQLLGSRSRARTAVHLWAR